MDLTPPSMIPSPTLSLQKLSQSPACGFDPGCQLEAAAASYPSPRLFDLHYEPTSPYRSFNLLANTRNAKKAPPPDTMADPGWRYLETAPPAFAAIHASSSSSGSNVLSADYDSFADYESGLSPVQFAPGGGYVAASSSCTATRTPCHVSDVQSTSTNAGYRTSFGYGPQHMTQAVKMDTGSLNGPTLGTSYPMAGGLHTPYSHPMSSMSSFHVASPQFVAENLVSSWEKQSCETSQFPDSGQSPRELSTTPSNATRSASLTRSRRGSRKHTTKEEANFQCSVEGCGKFFSRSYNFKSHMETHDEQREYPFPCLISGCTKKFVRKTDLQRHHQSVHKKERNHGCDFCGRLFARKDTLRR